MQSAVRSLARLAVYAAPALFISAHASAQIYDVTVLQPSGYYTSSARAGTTGMQFGSGQPTISVTSAQALEWSGTAASFVNLEPSNGGGTTYSGSQIQAAAGGMEGGIATLASSGFPDAVLWNGSSTTVTDLNPAGYNASEITGMTTTTQVGYALDSIFTSHPALWTGTAGTYTDLSLAQTSGTSGAGIQSGQANGISGNGVIGQGSGVALPTSVISAVYWSSPTTNYVLQPGGYADSRGTGISGTLAVGFGNLPAATNNALAWDLTNPASPVFTDINPTGQGFTVSAATGVQGTIIVGYGNTAVGGTTAGKTHALLWNGVGTTATDLHALLPKDPLGANYVDSEALGITANGTIYGYADYVNASSVTITNAVEWRLAPAPSALPILATGLGALPIAIRKRRSR